MKRRDFITLLGGAAAAWPVAARAQQPGQVRRIGVLINAAATETIYQAYLAAFVQGLRQLGWTEGQNLRIDVRWNDGDAEVARIYAAQLIGLMPDVILVTSTINLTAIQHATSTVPVVFVQVADPVAQGFVANVRQPGGNLTGFSLLEFSLGGKWLDLLKKVTPALARVAVIFNPDMSPQYKPLMQATEAAAPSLGVEAITVPLRTTDAIEPALVSFARAPNGGLILLYDTFTRLHYAMIADLARRLHLPSISSGPDFAKLGGLMDYGPRIELVGHYRQAATYVDRILKGEKPGDLPIQAVDRYTLVINLKTAKALGLAIPPSVLAIADEVIE
jgi:putative ABC transport system substrate-binding protein